VPGHDLARFAAGAAGWMVRALRAAGGEYVAFVAADQVVCLSEETAAELRTILQVAFRLNADMIFFDGPPALSPLRLSSLIDASRRPSRNSAIALARDRTLLKHYGGAHVFQCVLIRKPLLPLLAGILEALLDASASGYDADYGIMDVALLPCLFDPVWLKRDGHPAALEINSRFRTWRAAIRRMFPISVPIEVFNVNTPVVLHALQCRVQLSHQPGGKL
jgi:hypothetical protein